MFSCVFPQRKWVQKTDSYGKDLAIPNSLLMVVSKVVLELRELTLISQKWSFHYLNCFVV